MISPIPQNKIIDLTCKYNPKMSGIFSFYPRKENEQNNDLDILIYFEQD